MGARCDNVRCLLPQRDVAILLKAFEEIEEAKRALRQKDDAARAIDRTKQRHSGGGSRK
jgi:hypothetical protein